MILSCQNLSKTFVDRPILKQASFQLEEHEKAAIVGVNGAGKTTLLKMIIGQLPADEGLITFAKDKTFGYLAQQSDLSSSHTIYEELLSVKQDLISMEQQLRDLEESMKHCEGTQLEEIMDRYTRMTHDFEVRGGLLYKSEDGSTLSLIGTLLVFASSLSYAIYIVGINQTSLKNVATLKVTFYVLLFGLSLFVARLLYSGVLNTPDQWYLWGNLLALAVFPTAISFLCTTGAIQYIGSTPTAILGALEPVTAIFFGIAVFGESLTVRESFGLVMIIVAVTFVIAGGNITSQLVRFRKLFPRLPIRSKKRN